MCQSHPSHQTIGRRNHRQCVDVSNNDLRRRQCSTVSMRKTQLHHQVEGTTHRCGFLVPAGTGTKWFGVVEENRHQGSACRSDDQVPGKKSPRTTQGTSDDAEQRPKRTPWMKTTIAMQKQTYSSSITDQRLASSRSGGRRQMPWKAAHFLRRRMFGVLRL